MFDVLIMVGALVFSAGIFTGAVLINELMDEFLKDRDNNKKGEQ